MTAVNPEIRSYTYGRHPIAPHHLVTSLKLKHLYMGRACHYHYHPMPIEIGNKTTDDKKPYIANKRRDVNNGV